jgi:hypothetical protein
MKEYVQANRKMNENSSVLSDIYSDNAKTKEDRFGNGMVLSYIDTIFSGNAQ